MIDRSARRALGAMARDFRVVAVIGPRQSGKTTPVREVFPDKPYVSLQLRKIGRDRTIVERPVKRVCRFP